MSPNTSANLLQFVCQNKPNRRSLLWAIGLCITQFVIFKILYPYPDFFDDSYSYIFAASKHLNISIWPIGYSKFLAIYHSITSSDTALVTFQYFLIQLAALYFYYTILFLFRTSQWTRNVLFIFLFANILTLYLSNLINSDALFAALSLFWISNLLWVICRPNTYHLVTHSILLLFCFTVRNNAYYYPIVSALAFIVSPLSSLKKAIGILLPFCLIIPFIIQTEFAAYKSTGRYQYSFFTGWQLANNALYIYDKVHLDSSKLPTHEAKELNNISANFFKHIHSSAYRTYLQSYVGNFFLKQASSPLKQYFRHHYGHQVNGQSSEVIAWGRASADFEPFGKYVILHNPLPYARYFVWPNLARYFIPPLSNFENYNYGVDSVDEIAKSWFDYPTNRIHAVSYTFQTNLIVYPALFLLFNVSLLWHLILLFRKTYKGAIRFDRVEKRCFWLIACYLTANLLFSLVATVNILRYQIMPMLIVLAFGLLIHDFLEAVQIEELETAKQRRAILYARHSPNA